jgi:uncharacterized membrane protein YbhN (UPF0104 family)
MAVLVIAGAMSLLGVVLIALIVFVEKLMPFGERSAQLTGAGLGLLAAFVAVYPDLSKFERHRWTKSVANAYPTARIDLKRPEIDLGGRKRLDFGTVRPRVQIPGPRPFSYSKPRILDVVWR